MNQKLEWTTKLGWIVQNLYRQYIDIHNSSYCYRKLTNYGSCQGRVRSLQQRQHLCDTKTQQLDEPH